MRAFPVTHQEISGHTLTYADAGMSLRDYFAARALPALIVEDSGLGKGARAREAYEFADAMLAAREVK